MNNNLLLSEKLLNKNNKLITKEYIKKILSKYGIKKSKINNLDIFQRAMIHKSYTQNYLNTLKQNQLDIIKNLDVNTINNDVDVFPLQKK